MQQCTEMQDADTIEIATIETLLGQMKQASVSFSEIVADYNANVGDKASRITVFPLYRWLTTDTARRVSPRAGVMELIVRSVARVCAVKAGRPEIPAGIKRKSKPKAGVMARRKARCQGKKKSQ